MESTAHFYNYYSVCAISLGELPMQERNTCNAPNLFSPIEAGSLSATFKRTKRTFVRTCPRRSLRGQHGRTGDTLKKCPVCPVQRNDRRPLLTGRVSIPLTARLVSIGRFFFGAAVFL